MALLMAEHRSKRRLAAILAADVVGYSRLMQADEVGTLEKLKARRKEILQPAVAKHNGRIVKLMGDGVLVEFSSAVEAVECAVRLQQAMQEANAESPTDQHVLLRIGVNLGDVLVEGSDLYGDGVNIAARLEGQAEPGGICISGNVHEEIRGKLNCSAEDLGDLNLKNIARPVRVFRIRTRGITPTSAVDPRLSDSRPSIGVLPFADMSGGQEQEYFADGITEDIITELARNRRLFVVARNSSFVFKGKAVNIAEVGRKLGVRYVVEGSVRKVGKRVRITAQLIEATSGNHIWAERYDRDLEDIFAVQDEVTRSIAASVPGHLESDIVKLSRRKPTESLDAYDHYLRGQEIVNRGRNDDINQAMAEFESAVTLDATFARAQAYLGLMHLRIWWQTHAPHELEEANKGTELAVRLDSADSRCLGIRGMYFLFAKDFDGALDCFQRALQLNPDDPDLNIMMPYYLTLTGQGNQALETALKAVRASPMFLPPSYQEAIADAFMVTRRYEEAAKSYLAIRGGDFYIHVNAAGCLAKLGRFEEARIQSRMAYELWPDWTTLAVNSSTKRTGNTSKS
jgi:adenylate cyclase